MSITTYMLRHSKFTPTYIISRTSSSSSKDKNTVVDSPRLAEFKKRLQEVPFPGESPPDGRQITPIKKLDQKTLQQPKRFEYAAFPDNTNPKTGEINGPKGPEPTRYGDWERKGRCSDF